MAMALIPIFDDILPEETEQFVKTLENPSVGSVSPTLGSTTCLILDEEDGKAAHN